MSHLETASNQPGPDLEPSTQPTRLARWRSRAAQAQREHPWLSLTIGLYIALSTVELARILLVAPTPTFATGVYGWEDAPAPLHTESRKRFRWTSADAYLLGPIEGPVLRIPVYFARPDAPVSLRLYFDERPLSDFELIQDGWSELAYYLPPILGEQRWQEVKRGWAATTLPGSAARHRSASMGELRPWASPPRPPSSWLHFNVGSTFVPSEVADATDSRRLGVGIGELGWPDVVPSDGLGLYDSETNAEGIAFRWTRLRASFPVTAGGNVALFSLRADHPDIDANPLTIDIYWEAKHVIELRLETRDWLPVEIKMPIPEGTRGVVSVHVSRTWSPATAGISADSRALGVAVTDIRWR